MLHACLHICHPRVQDAVAELQRQIRDRDSIGSGFEIHPVAGLSNAVVLKGHGPCKVEISSSQGTQADPYASVARMH